MRTLELLAPAKNLEIGKAAIDHGADAVYIGAPRFGARAAVGNSVNDIRELCRYAHLFGGKVHVTVNTIVYDDELEDTLIMIRDLADAGVDALLLQDMGVAERCLQMQVSDELPRLPVLHASTQCDTRSAEKVRWLQSVGFSRAVLARELSVEEIAAIHRAVPHVELEVFVHGALCVSYSGVCYASQHCFKRSANRGECAQFCRLRFDLLDSNGREIEHQRHLLSLKDMCRIDHLEALADAGACSFKIEGRLKDIDYVKNVVSAYSRRLDELVARRPEEYCRASRGRVEYHFEPNLKKTFNRGFTSYFLHGRQPDIASFDTPKAMGEYVGKVKEMRGNSFNVAGTAVFSNGDGLCFINANRELEGFRVNKAEGNRLYPLKMPHSLRPGMSFYRNNDVAFEKLMAGNTAERKISLKLFFSMTEDGFSLSSEGVEAKIAFAHQPAHRVQTDNILRQLGKLGGTQYVCDEVVIEPGADSYFIPSSLLADLRRKLVEELNSRQSLTPAPVTEMPVTSVSPVVEDASASIVWQPEYKRFPYLYNISNQAAVKFYEGQGMANVAPAFEQKETGHPLVMQCRHCIRYSLGFCVKRGGERPRWREPLFLALPDGRRFQLEFDCHECQMNVYAV
ncbi:peptidase, U32 family [Segatella buccae D17]|uniref:peptidase U32 family protein n=1 Tax=Segatella buccae TaxID=28126 RepID=UPI0001C409D7|nr:U32 family peptidase [Segatella buccae]EFC76541.1 peptidase, U32 family [Segatella buccae D17]